MRVTGKVHTDTAGDEVNSKAACVGEQGHCCPGTITKLCPAQVPFTALHALPRQQECEEAKSKARLTVLPRTDLGIMTGCGFKEREKRGLHPLGLRNAASLPKVAHKGLCGAKVAADAKAWSRHNDRQECE